MGWLCDPKLVNETKELIKKDLPSIEFNDQYDGVYDRRIIDIENMNKVINININKVNVTFSGQKYEPSTTHWYQSDFHYCTREDFNS